MNATSSMNMKSRTARVMVWARPSRDAPEHALVVQHDVVLVDRKLGAESAAVEVLVEITAVGEPRISLPHGSYGQLRCGDPRHDELPPLADGHGPTANRERVREGGRPDVDVDAAVEVRPGPTGSVAPVTLAIGLEPQGPRAGFGRHPEPRRVEPPRRVPGEVIGQAEGAAGLVEREDGALGRALPEPQMLEPHALPVLVPDRRPADHPTGRLSHLAPRLGHGHDLQQVAVRVLEVEAAPASTGVDLAVRVAVWPAAVWDAFGLRPSKDRVELGVADMEGVVMAL